MCSTSSGVMEGMDGVAVDAGVATGVAVCELSACVCSVSSVCNSCRQGSRNEVGELL